MPTRLSEWMSVETTSNPELESRIVSAHSCADRAKGRKGWASETTYMPRGRERSTAFQVRLRRLWGSNSVSVR